MYVAFVQIQKDSSATFTFLQELLNGQLVSVFYEPYRLSYGTHSR